MQLRLTELTSFMQSIAHKAEIVAIRIPNRASDGKVYEDDSQWPEEWTAVQPAMRRIASIYGNDPVEIQVKVRWMPSGPDGLGWMSPEEVRRWPVAA